MKFLVTAYLLVSNGVRVVSMIIFEDGFNPGTEVPLEPARCRARAEAERLAVAGHTEIAVWEFDGAPAVRKTVDWEEVG